MSFAKLFPFIILRNTVCMKIWFGDEISQKKNKLLSYLFHNIKDFENFRKIGEYCKNHLYKFYETVFLHDFKKVHKISMKILPKCFSPNFFFLG